MLAAGQCPNLMTHGFVKGRVDLLRMPVPSERQFCLATWWQEQSAGCRVFTTLLLLVHVCTLTLKEGWQTNV